MYPAKASCIWRRGCPHSCRPGTGKQPSRLAMACPGGPPLTSWIVCKLLKINKIKSWAGFCWGRALPIRKQQELSAPHLSKRWYAGGVTHVPTNGNLLRRDATPRHHPSQSAEILQSHSCRPGAGPGLCAQNCPCDGDPAQNTGALAARPGMYLLFRILHPAPPTPWSRMWCCR